MDEWDMAILRVFPSPDSGASAWMGTPQIADGIRHPAGEPPIVKRSVQRRLDKLEDAGFVERYDWDSPVTPEPLSTDRKTAYYRIVDGAMGFATRMSGMTASQALALQSLRRFGSKLIPAHVMSEMRGLFEVAEKYLRGLPPQRRLETRWPAKVDVVEDTFRLTRPAVDGGILATVSEALFKEQVLGVVYQSVHLARKKQEPREKKISPLGLIQHRGYLYLVAQGHGKSAGKRTQYRLDRMKSAALLIEPFDYPSDFSLEDYIKKDKEFDYCPQPEVEVKLRFTNWAGDALLESKVHPEQKIEFERASDDEVTPSVVILRAKVSPSLRMTWWLRSFGPDVEVLEPADLRETMASESRRVASLYARAPG
jgi:predicted DNA-binding transcriptional regulator YafY